MKVRFRSFLKGLCNLDFISFVRAYVDRKRFVRLYGKDLYDYMLLYKDKMDLKDSEFDKAIEAIRICWSCEHRVPGSDPRCVFPEEGFCCSFCGCPIRSKVFGDHCPIGRW